MNWLRGGQSRSAPLPDETRPQNRRLREDPLDAVFLVAETIGPRPATSLGEARAAAYLDGRLRRAGMRVTADPFVVAVSEGWDGVAVAVLALAAVGLYFWFPLAAVAVLLPALLLALWRAFRPDAPLLARRRESQNVIGTRAGPQRAPWRVVLLAPLDAPPQLPAALRPLSDPRNLALARAAACLLVALAALVGLWDVQRLWWYVQMLPAAALLALAVQSVWLGRAAGSPGAISHAGALAVLLSTVETLGPTERVELWAVGLGATVPGGGLADLLRRYPFEREQTLFVALESIGAGELAYLTREGLLREAQADPTLLDCAAAADSADPRINVAPRPYRGGTLAGRLLHGGRRALAIVCLGTDGRPPLYADPADTPQAVDPALLERAVRLVGGIVRQIDQTT
ncbi:MAG TPA: hypothetical protein VFS21_05190 [Roseiflexaceae bacterium]|nr:hypothetical protein [Roseiflexaceae bacterium]